MDKKLKPFLVVKKLKEKRIKIFSPLEFKRVFEVSKHAVQWFIKTHTKKGLFVKLRNGLYMLADDPANNYLIANRLNEPSYISFDTALSFYRIIPETVYTVTSATSKKTKEFQTNNIRFVYHKIKKEAYKGYQAIKYLESTVLIAEPEKALADYLYFIALGRRELNYERLNLKEVEKKKLLKYSKLFEKSKMNKLIKRIYAESRKPQKIH